MFNKTPGARLREMLSLLLSLLICAQITDAIIIPANSASECNEKGGTFQCSTCSERNQANCNGRGQWQDCTGNNPTCMTTDFSPFNPFNNNPSYHRACSNNCNSGCKNINNGRRCRSCGVGRCYKRPCGNGFTESRIDSSKNSDKVTVYLTRASGGTVNGDAALSGSPGRLAVEQGDRLFIELDSPLTIYNIMLQVQKVKIIRIDFFNMNGGRVKRIEKNNIPTNGIRTLNLDVMPTPPPVLRIVITILRCTAPGSSKCHLDGLKLRFCSPDVCSDGSRKTLSYEAHKSREIQSAISGVSHSGEAFRNSGQTVSVSNNQDSLQVSLLGSYKIITVCIRNRNIKRIRVTLKRDGNDVYVNTMNLLAVGLWKNTLFEIPDYLGGADSISLTFIHPSINQGQIKNVYIVVCIPGLSMTCMSGNRTIESPGALADLTIEGPYSGELLNVWEGNDPPVLSNNPESAKYTIDLSEVKDIVSVTLRTLFADGFTVTLIGQDGSVVFVGSAVVANADDFSTSTVNTDVAKNITRIVITFDFGNGREIVAKRLQIVLCQPARECVCRIQGDPIVSSCDNELLFLRGPGYFPLAIVGENQGCDWKFKSFVKNEERGDVTIPVRMIVKYWDNGAYVTVEINDNNTALIDNVEAPSLPYSNGVVTISSESLLAGEFTKIALGDCASFYFKVNPPKSRSLLLLDGRFMGKVQGVCGDFDGVQDDMRLRNGTISGDFGDISDSYQQNEPNRK